MLLSDETALLRVRLTPRSGRDAIVKRESALLYVRVAAAPVEGAANRALVELISRTLHTAESRIELVSGESSRDKTLRIRGFTQDELDTLVESALSRSAS